MQTRAFKIIKDYQTDLTFQGSKAMSMTIRFMLFNQGTLEPLRPFWRVSNRGRKFRNLQPTPEQRRVLDYRGLRRMNRGS